jgi:hypothetical protein
MERQARRGLDGRQIPAGRLVPEPEVRTHEAAAKVANFAKVPPEAPAVRLGPVSPRETNGDVSLHEPNPTP